MSLFEYVSVMMSVILALGIARLLGGLGGLIRFWDRIEARRHALSWIVLLLISPPLDGRWHRSGSWSSSR